MFSYRHAFHAGNHADVLKHTVQIATLKHLMEKDTALTLVDTHAGAGLYRLDSDFAQTSGEAEAGITQLLTTLQSPGAELPAPALQDYLNMVADFNPSGRLQVYPGSPFVAQHLMRAQDRLKLFELHPTDTKTLSANIAQLDAGRQIAVLREDGFAGVRKFLPPPSRRGVVLCDPSYELKTDYAKVLDFTAEMLKRFVTGVYLIWYPIIPRPEAHDLPRRLKTMTQKAGRPWLHATLTVKSGNLVHQGDGSVKRPGLAASGMFVINPPYTLKPALAAALPQLEKWLGQDHHAGHELESAG